MKTSLLDYDLPEGLIATHPVEPRDECRMLRLERRSGAVSHHVFADLPGLLRPGDLIVTNNSRVIRARLYGKRRPSGGAIEALLLRPSSRDGWWALVKPGRKIKNGDRLEFGDGRLHAKVARQGGKGERLLRFDCPPEDLDGLVEQIGQAPLPPYILRERRRLLGDDAGEGRRILETEGDKTAYQTVYAKRPGSVAAPTAGLHFTATLLEQLRRQKHEVVEVTLHVGAGTFRPVTTDTIEEHAMHVEGFSVSGVAAEAINAAKSEGRRVVAVGTTVTRVLEHVACEESRMRAGDGSTDLLITPGFRFRVVDALITNFHLPRSTLMALVCAFGGRALVMRAYEEAIRERYRFYSYGDAMFID